MERKKINGYIIVSRSRNGNGYVNSIQMNSNIIETNFFRKLSLNEQKNYFKFPGKIISLLNEEGFLLDKIFNLGEEEKCFISYINEDEEIEKKKEREKLEKKVILQ